MENLFDIKDNVTVITGGTGVLGRAIAKYLALNGAKVVILGRKEEIGQEIVADIKAAGGQCEFLKTDVMNQEVVQQNHGEALEYVLVSESGPDHDKHFEMEVHLNSNVLGRGVGGSKKKAEQNAAKEALELMGIETR